MNPNKKSYAMKMLQLALALSLLHVDPDFFLLQQRFDSWDSQLESYDGGDHGGWELEMLRAVPMVEYPYANRKSMMPLIEDLIHYDRHENQYNVTAYLLTQPNDVTANQTAAVQELQTPAAGGGGGTVTAATSSPAGAAATSLEQSLPGDTGGLGESSQFDLFLQSEHFQDQRPVWEQNLADLEDFGDLSVRNPYTGLKDEINQLHQRQPATSSDNEATEAAAGAATSFNVNLEAFLPVIKTEPGLALNDTYPDPDDTVRIKVEQLDNDESSASGSENNTNTTQTCQPDGGDNAVGACSSTAAAATGAGAGFIKIEQNETYITGLDPFISHHELTNEESEIVEVLWKQDVDLGYSLSQNQLLGAVSSGELPSGSNGTFEADAKAFLEKSDNIEDLKALDQLKEDKDKPEDDGISSSNDGWANIPFTVDNETGEFIRLPLDEILNDVLEFASLAGEQNEIGSDSIASTSKGSSAVAERKPKTEHNDENNRSGANGVGDDVDVALKDEKDDNFWLNSAESSGGKRGDRDRTSSGCNKTEYDDTDNGNDADADLSDIEASSLAASPLFDLDDEAKEELADFDIMLQSAAPPPPSSFHHPHPHHYSHHAAGAHHPHRPTATATSGGVGVGQNYAVGSGANSAFQRQAATATGFHHGPHQGRMPLSRGVSMDLAFFNPMGVSEMSPYPHYAGHHPHHHAGAPPPPPPHHHAHYSYQAGVQHAQYPHHHHPGHRHGMMHPNAALGDLCPPAQPHYGHNLGSAVSSSMHLTNTTTQSHHDDLGAAAAAAGGDMMYYSNGPSDMNHTTDGFINSIWNDEDLHLMDMNVTDSFCRIVDVNNSTSNNSSVLGGLSGGHVSGASSAATANSLMGLTGDLGGGAAAAAAAAIGATASATAGHGGVHSGQSGTDRLDASSDSAVSSMGSERVPSLSDGEWGEGSDSAQDYHQGKYGGAGAGGPYDYSYQNSSVARQPPVAQKKHQMFGKRFQHEQPANGPAATAETAGSAHVPLPGAANTLLHGQQPAASIKYEYDPYPTVANHHGPQQQQPHHGDPTMGPLLGKVYELNHGAGAVGGDLSPYSLDYSLRQPRTPHDIVQHNHTYTMPQGTGSLPRPQQRDKKGGSLGGASGKSGKGSATNSSSGASEEEHLTRDEKRARALNVPIPVPDIINLPMDEFNERLSKYDLTESQLSLIRDIRRRGKNKVAAQNCRKRKLDQILSLEDEVKEVRKRKEHLEAERDSYEAERKRISSKFAALHRHIFQYLRDPEGNPCSTADYSLQQAADGSIFLLPRDNTKGDSASVSRANQASMQQQGPGHHPHGHQMNGGGAAAQQQQQQHQQQQQQHSLVLGGQQRAPSHLSNQQQQQQQHALPHALPPHSLHHNSHHTQMPHQKE